MERMHFNMNEFIGKESIVRFGGNSQVVLVVKNLPANAGDLRDLRVRSLDQEDPLEEEMATYFSILAWEIPGSWTEESPCSVGDLGSIPGLGRFGGGNGNSLQYSYLENPHGQRSLAGYSPYNEAT